MRESEGVMTQVTSDKMRQETIDAGKSRRPPVDLDDAPKDGPLFEGTDVPVGYLFAYLDEGYNLYTFLKYFPSVCIEQAIAAIRIRERINADDIIHSERERVSGTPVFRGSRVPVRTLFNYMSYGYPLDEFLEAFPSVEREQAISALEMAGRLLETYAYETAATKTAVLKDVDEAAAG